MKYNFGLISNQTCALDQIVLQSITIINKEDNIDTDV